MKNKSLRNLGFSAGLTLVASLTATPSMAEINQECLFTGEITQKQTDSPMQIRFTGMADGENARCYAKRRGSRSKIQFKASGDIQSLPEGSAVLYRYQEWKDGGSTWELISATPAI
jgi:hypothetical protein